MAREENAEVLTMNDKAHERALRYIPRVRGIVKDVFNYELGIPTISPGPGDSTDVLWGERGAPLLLMNVPENGRISYYGKINQRELKGEIE